MAKPSYFEFAKKIVLAEPDTVRRERLAQFKDPTIRKQINERLGKAYARAIEVALEIAIAAHDELADEITPHVLTLEREFLRQGNLIEGTKVELPN